MNDSRVIGNNIALYIKRKGLSREKIADQMGMIESDIQKILLGRLLLSERELRTFAKILEVKPEELIEQKNESEYKELIHCMGSIDNYENADVILDYIETYITLIEDSTN